MRMFPRRKCKETEPKELQLIGWESQAVVQFTLFLHDSLSFAFPYIEKYSSGHNKEEEGTSYFGHMAVPITSPHLSYFVAFLKTLINDMKNNQHSLLNGSRR
jgi:hypothetical protein